MILKFESEDINSNDVIIDLRRVAQKLNSNMLSSSEYIENGGKYSLSIFDDDFLRKYKFGILRTFSFVPHEMNVKQP